MHNATPEQGTNRTSPLFIRIISGRQTPFHRAARFPPPPPGVADNLPRHTYIASNPAAPCITHQSPQLLIESEHYQSIQASINHQALARQSERYLPLAAVGVRGHLWGHVSFQQVTDRISMRLSGYSSVARPASVTCTGCDGVTTFSVASFANLSASPINR